MHPPLWHPPIELSPAEQTIVASVKRAKLFIFLRQVRHELFNDEFQAELAEVFQASPRGQPPIAPAKLALTTIVQAYTGASDDEAIEALVMDRRWQLVLDCLDCQRAPFGKGTLVRFRAALIKHRLDRRLVERTVELAEHKGGFGSGQLRAALDSSPLWGAGKVEDTYNLLGHALRKALSVIARPLGRELAAVAAQAGAAVVAGSSLKAALDLNWNQPEERNLALGVVLGVLESVEAWWQTQSEQSPMPQVNQSLATAQQVKDQDLEVAVDGSAKLRRGVARSRRISIEDAHMRHGRKSRTQRVDGYKRHLLRDLDTGLVRSVGVTPANVPEAWVSDAISNDLRAQAVQLVELHIDRAYLTSKLVRTRPDDLQVYCKAWPVRNRGGRFLKTAFHLDWERLLIRCPNQVMIPFQVGQAVHFPASVCAECSLWSRCTTSPRGRSVSIHPDERFLEELRQRQLTPAGRAKLRERVSVEHSLAHVHHWQGNRARYRGLRKNLFDLRRMAVVHNLHAIARLPTKAQDKVI